MAGACLETGVVGLYRAGNDDESDTDDGGEYEELSGRRKDTEAEEEYLSLPVSVANSKAFKGVTKNKKTGEVEVTVKLASRFAGVAFFFGLWFSSLGHVFGSIF